MEKPEWIKDKKVSNKFEVIRGKYDGYKDFVSDKFYVLIRVYHDTHEIGLGICDKDHVLHKEFRGRIAQEIYVPLFKFQPNILPDHAAYIGKELKKAEIALVLNIEYVQE